MLRTFPTVLIVTGGCYFFAVNLLERQRTLLTDHIDLLLRDSVRRMRRLYSFHIVGGVAGSSALRADCNHSRITPSFIYKALIINFAT